MNPVFVLLLLCVWLFLAYQSFQRGNTAMAVIFLVIGAALTTYRMRGRAKQ